MVIGAAALFMLFPASAFACSVCFSPVENDPMNVALRASVFCMLAVTFGTLGLFAKFFWNIRKRERMLLK